LKESNSVDKRTSVARASASERSAYRHGHRCEIRASGGLRG